MLRPIVEAAIPDRPIRKALDYARVVAREQDRLQAMPEGFRRSTLGLDLEAGLALARDAALRGAADRVRQLLQRRLDDIDAQLREATKLVVDVHAARLLRRREPLRASSGRPGAGLPRPDDEHVIWPFDGEFWRDELGSYRQVVVSQCDG
jgi:hypothetical protein